MMLMRMIFVGAALSMAASAMATTPVGVVDPYGAGSISKGHFKGVEQRLSASFEKGDRSPEVLLNLAAIQMQKHDGARAAELYRMVLDQPNVDMATLSSSAWSHDIAHRALSASAAAN